MIKFKSPFHAHEWHLRIQAIGELPKQNTPEPIGIRGEVSMCQCGAKRFKPEAKGLRTVEVE